MPSEHAGPRSLRHLLAAVIMIGSNLDLQSVLQRIIEAAVELVGARYGALGVLNETGTGLAQFITVGIDDESHRAIGSLPKGLGLLGTLITDARPLRLPDLREHADRSGFPPNHPPMTSFLGVPIRVRDEVFGNLYLTDKMEGEVFTDVDEELALGLASAAGVAIENARLYEQVRLREAALAAMQEIATELVAGAEPLDSLRFVARKARELVRADLATVALPQPDSGMLIIEVSEGPVATTLVGARFPRAGSVSGDVLETGQSIVLEDASRDHRIAQPQVQTGEIGPALFVALVAEGVAFGTLSVARQTGAPPFSPADLEMVRTFAAHASVALEHERGRRRLQRMTLLEDQERIARDLHDSVIQRLFSVGLSLQATSRLVQDAQARGRLAAAIDELDLTVRHIRTVIFDVEAPRSGRDAGLRAKVLDLTKEAGRALGCEPRVTFAGAVDTTVPDPLTEDVLATLREALSNAARHGHAREVNVDLAVTATSLVLRVADDGVGITGDRPDMTGGHGLRNMRTRAERRGGEFDVRAGQRCGTVVEWQAPLPAG
ncbi:MAG: GAF domain-containing protein [Acidimicrobiales bacterium]